MVQVWYPAQRANSGQAASYVPELAELAPDLAEAVPEVNLLRVRTAAWFGAAPLPGRRFPGLIFSHGMNSARYFYTGLVQDLASHGFVVAAIDHPFWALAAAYDGRHRVSLAQSMASRDRLTSDQIDGLMQDGVGEMAEDQAFVATRLAGWSPGCGGWWRASRSGCWAIPWAAWRPPRRAGGSACSPPVPASTDSSGGAKDSRRRASRPIR
jgi:hypothetical protein